MESKDWAEDFVRRVIHADRYRPIREAEFADLVAELRARVGTASDDDELVTGEWLHSVLTMRMGYGFVVTPLLSIWRTTRHGWGLHYHGGEGDAFDSLPSLIAEAPTRGHVRRLLAALGIALPAAPKGESQ